MSGDPSTTDRMVNAFLASHQVPSLDDAFADRVLAAAQSSRTGPATGSPWPRQRSRPWRRSPLWLSFLALNIVAASAVAAMVSGFPVWHHVSAIVQKVAHTWHRETTHLARHQIAPRRLVASQAPAPVPAPGPAMIASTVTEPRPAAMHPLKTREAIAPFRRPKPGPMVIARLGHQHNRVMQRRRERLMQIHPGTSLNLHSHPHHRDEFPDAADRRKPANIFKAERDRTVRLPEPPATTQAHELRPVEVQPAEPYDPRLAPQHELRKRQEGLRKHLGALRGVRSEERRTHPFGRRLESRWPRPHRGRFKF